MSQQKTRVKSLELRRRQEGRTDLGGLHPPDAAFVREKNFGLAEEDQSSARLLVV